MGALELAPDKSPKGFAAPGKVGPRLRAELLARGVIARAIGDSLAFCPPMIITEAEIDEMFAPVEAGARRDRGLGAGRGAPRLTLGLSAPRRPPIVARPRAVRRRGHLATSPA